MPIDFGKLRRPGSTRESIIDPIQLFHALKVTDPAINDLWLAQGDALREWHQNRHLGDIAIILNTGAGKTLVGLLAAQSLVNETSGRVLYACSNIQLVKQTLSKANDYGLQVATYTQGEFTNGHLYDSGSSPCLTTYHALFNGKSRFLKESVKAVVFDDAHTAEHLLREQFTLRLPKEACPSLFSRIADLFRGYFERVGLDVGYRELLQGNSPGYWFVPPFAVCEQTAALSTLLLDAKLGDHKKTKFAWEHLKDKINLCTLFVSGEEIVMTPPITPVPMLRYFRKETRRLYLSATLSAKDGFLRTFGRVPDRSIAPVTTAGECERMIIIPGIHPDLQGKTSSNGRDIGVAAAKFMIKEQKALILVPSYRRARTWHDVVLEPDDDIASEIENFKNTDPPAKLLLVGRYDGIDLPGDTCRMMVIDDLPSGVGPLERFLWERLGAAKVLQSTVASRVIQSFGRISRGMSDHGVVILTGEHLVRWILNPENLAVLPQFLRVQLNLGIELSRSGGFLPKELPRVADQCLKRDPNWVSYYSEVMNEHTAAMKLHDAQRAEVSGEGEEALFLARVEVEFGRLFWKREYDKAAKCLLDAKDRVFGISRNVGAWYLLWCGYCYDLMGDRCNAQQLYLQAGRVTSSLPPPDLPRVSTDGLTLPKQVMRVTELLTDGTRIDEKAFSRLGDVHVVLDASGSTSAQVEEALRVLGEYLGLVSSRPDREFGTGPDVLWDPEDGGPALAMEVKAGKQKGSYYTKYELGQLRDHVRWVREHSSSSTIYPAFVGPVLSCSGGCNPDPEMVTVDVTQFKRSAKILRDALKDVVATALPATLPKAILEVFQQRSLLWPTPYEAMEKYRLQETRAL